MKKLLSVSMVIMLVFSLVLVGNINNDVALAKNSDIRVGIIFTEAGLGGQSFNDLAFDGVKQAAEDFGIKFDYVEPSSVSDQEIVQDEMAMFGEYELIIAVGFEQVDALNVVARNYPNQKFVLLDAEIDLPNVASYLSKEQDASFLIGALAALTKNENAISHLSSEKSIGFIGGVDSPLIRKFAAGYEAGARYIDNDYRVYVDYVGAFNDPTTAKVISETMYQKGADLQYHAAGASGMGMFQAAQDKNFVTVGVNSNQNFLAPDHIMASMLKLVNQAAYSAIEDVINGEFKPGTHLLGLAEDGVGYTTADSNIEIPAEIIEVVEELKAKVASGELVVPETLEDVEAFLAAR